MDEKTKEFLYRELPDKFLSKAIDLVNKAFDRERRGEREFTSAFAVCSKDNKYYDTGVMDIKHTGSDDYTISREILSLMDKVEEKCRADKADTKAVFLAGGGAKRFQFHPSNILGIMGKGLRVVCRNSKRRDEPDYIDMHCLVLDESVYGKDFGDKMIEYIRRKEYGKVLTMLEQIKEHKKEVPLVFMRNYLLLKKE